MSAFSFKKIIDFIYPFWNNSPFYLLYLKYVFEMFLVFPYVLKRQHNTLYTWSKSHWMLKCLYSNNKIKRDEWMNKRSKYYTSHVILPFIQPPLTVICCVIYLLQPIFMVIYWNYIIEIKRLKEGFVVLYFDDLSPLYTTK